MEDLDPRYGGEEAEALGLDLDADVEFLDYCVDAEGDAGDDPEEEPK